VSILKQVVKEKQYSVSWEVPGIGMWLPKESALNFTYSIPDDIYVAPITEEHAEIVNEEWPHKSEGSVHFVRSMLMLNGGLGLFDKNTNQLLSWLLKNDQLIPGFLQTIGSAKRRGLGSLITQIFCKQYAEEENLDLLVFIVHDNMASQGLFRKLGFKQLNKISWLRVIVPPV